MAARLDAWLTQGGAFIDGVRASARRDSFGWGVLTGFWFAFLFVVAVVA